MSDPIARKVFLTLTREEQLGILYDLAIDTKQVQANFEAVHSKKHIELDNDFSRMDGEIDGIGRRKSNDKTLSTSQNIRRAVQQAKGYDWGLWFIERVLPSIVTGMIVTLLILTYGKTP